jgi:hypothetical protein
VSDVLARDEALVEIFVRHAPHFAKLRNRTMRRVMARLVTVEQAARTANLAPEVLVAEINAALGFVDSERSAPDSAHVDDAAGAVAPAQTTPDATQHPANAPVVEVDVREDLRSGREPFSQIMSAVGALGGDEVLLLRTTFEPAPLFAVLAKRGFSHESHSAAADDWSTWFWRAPATAGAAAISPARAETDLASDTASDAASNNAPDGLPDEPLTTYLDVRGLQPPEPLMRTLAALEVLPEGHTLVQINSRVPQFLFPVLVERGFAYQLDDSQPERVLLRLWHAQ